MINLIAEARNQPQKRRNTYTSRRYMDTGEGRLERFDRMDELDDLRAKFPKSKGVFTVGEELTIKGSLFKVKDISPFGIKLKLLKEE